MLPWLFFFEKTKKKLFPFYLLLVFNPLCTGGRIHLKDFLMQPLATCMHNLQLGKMAIGLQISEPWLREYQVLIFYWQASHALMI